MFMNVLNSKFMNERQAKLSVHERNSEFMNEMNIHPSRIAISTHQIHYVDASIHINQRMNNKYMQLQILCFGLVPVSFVVKKNLEARRVKLDPRSLAAPGGGLRPPSNNSQESKYFFCNVDVRLRPARTIPFAGPPAALVGRGDAAAASCADAG